MTSQFLRNIALLLASSIVLPDVAAAAERRVCFSMKFREARDTQSYNSPLKADPGAKRGREADNTSTPVIGHLIELWDEDSGADDFIGRYMYAGTGASCFTFEWEGDLWLSMGEANPDVLVKYIHEVRNTDLVGDKVRAVDPAEATLPDIAWTGFVYDNCLAGSDCDIAPGANLAVTTSTGTTRAARVNALDTAQRQLEAFGDDMDEATSGVIKMTYPCVEADASGPGTPGTPHGCLGKGAAHSRDHFHVNNGSGAKNGRTPSHELGHILHYNQFETDDLKSAGAHATNDSRLGDQAESFVTVEGWADFVSVVSWWDDENSASAPTISFVDIEAAEPYDTSSCAANSGIPIQFTKGMWDMVDANNEVAVSPAGTANPDSVNTSPANMVQALGRFDLGIANRQTEEFAFGTDPDAMNARDIFVNNAGFSGFGTGSFTTLLNHNCLGTQDNN